MSEPVVTVVTGSGSGNRKSNTRSTSTRKTSTRKTTSSVSEKELNDALADCLAVGLLAYFQYVAQIPKKDRDELDMTSEEADAITKPFARLINRHASGQAAGVVAGSRDWIVAIAAIMAYTDRAAPIVRRTKVIRGTEKRERARKAQPNGNGIRPNSQPAEATGFSLGFPGVGYGIGPQATQD